MLTLNTLRCPDEVAPERRSVAGGEFGIGRGIENDWVLADPDRHLSKRHCALAFRAGRWELTDLSANGTFLNGASTPLGSRPAVLDSGDRIRLGAYEIEVSITADRMQSSFEGRSAAVDDPFGGEPSGFEPPRRRDDEFGSGDLDPFAEDDFPFREPARSDHAPAIEDAFRPPPPAAAAIPDDWDLDWNAPKPQAAAERPAPAMPAPTPVTPAAVPVPPQMPDAGEASLLAAFLRGAGLADVAVQDPAIVMEALGAALRATVSGLRETMIARASIKGEFRIEQTMIRAAGNNPLKFSAGDDDALAAMVGIGRRNTMPAAQAIAESLRDMRLHELATMSAMQEAVRALMSALAPAVIEREADKGGLALLPGAKKARAWDAFTAVHERTERALSDDFDSAFGRSFARAYERSLRELQDESGRR